MNRYILLAMLGLLVCLLMVGLATDEIYAQATTTATAGDAIATAQTSLNQPAGLQEVPAAVPVVGVVPAVNQRMNSASVQVLIQPRRVYIRTPAVTVAVAPPMVVRAAKYRRLYSTPVRDACFGRYRTVVTPVWYPLRR